mmetsp:Transcript_6814/g.12497  ORF Transcript_6814/g.12497 Transcript_6814/m.12497 type:complete len:302 (+) Transcript_6814:146-1051(+)
MCCPARSLLLEWTSLFVQVLDEKTVQLLCVFFQRLCRPILGVNWREKRHPDGFCVAGDPVAVLAPYLVSPVEDDRHNGAARLHSKMHRSFLERLQSSIFRSCAFGENTDAEPMLRELLPDRVHGFDRFLSVTPINKYRAVQPSHPAQRMKEQGLLRDRDCSCAKYARAGDKVERGGVVGQVDDAPAPLERPSVLQPFRVYSHAVQGEHRGREDQHEKLDEPRPPPDSRQEEDAHHEHERDTYEKPGEAQDEPEPLRDEGREPRPATVTLLNHRNASIITSASNAANCWSCSRRRRRRLAAH